MQTRSDLSGKNPQASVRARAKRTPIVVGAAQVTAAVDITLGVSEVTRTNRRLILIRKALFVYNCTPTAAKQMSFHFSCSLELFHLLTLPAYRST